MADIRIKTPHTRETLPLIQHALEQERRFLKDAIATAKTRIAQLANQLNVTPEMLRQGAVARTEQNEAALIELEGEIALLDRLQEDLSHLDSLEVCA